MKRSQFWWAEAVFAALVLVSPPTALGQRSPCPDIFRYKQDDNGVTFGELQIPNVSSGSHEITLKMSLKKTTRDNSAGDEEMYLQDKQNLNENVKNGKPIKYTVKFPAQTLPKITEVAYDSQILCNGPKEKFSGLRVEYISEIILGETLIIPQASRKIYIVPNRVVNRHHTTRAPKPSSGGSSYPCGVPPPSAGNFVVNGLLTSPGDWPWLVTVNLKKDAEYQCTGAMVSPSVVITAGHCVFNGATKRRADEMLLEFGVHDRVNREKRQNIVQRHVSSIELPTGHTVKSPPIHDLAALVTDGPVTYSNTIVPVCLWSGARDLHTIITTKERGTVVGWGRDELDNDATVDPRRIKLPIIPFSTCTRSHEHFRNIIKGRQYCAGTGDGRSGVCNGDSGGGMFFYRNNHWELKGVVSFGVNSAVHSCDLNEYVVFTDVTHPDYGMWLTKVIEAHANAQAAEVGDDY